MDELPPIEVNEKDFEFLNDKYWLLRPVLEERGIQIDADDEHEDSICDNLHVSWLNDSFDPFQNEGTDERGENGERWHLLKRLNELKMLERVENQDKNRPAVATAPTNHLHMSRTVTRPRFPLSKNGFNHLNDVNTRTFTRPKRSPVTSGRNSNTSFCADDLMNISEVEIEADLTRILSTPRNVMNGNSHRLSLDSLPGESQLKNNQSFIIGKRDHRKSLPTPFDQPETESTSDKLNTTFVAESDTNGHCVTPPPPHSSSSLSSSSFANNYNDVQEIARKQEEVLKKKSNLLRNNTIVKSKRERIDAGMANAQSEKDLIINTSVDDFSQIDLNSTFCKEPVSNFILTPESVFNSASPDKVERQMSRRSFVIAKSSTITKKPANQEQSADLLNDNHEYVDAYSEFPPTKLHRISSAGSLATQTITKNYKANALLKRTKTFKVRESQSISEENLNMTSGKDLKIFSPIENRTLGNGQNGTINKAESGDLVKNHLVQSPLQKMYSKSNNNLNESFTLSSCRSEGQVHHVDLSKNRLGSNKSLNKPSTKIPGFASRIKPPQEQPSIRTSSSQLPSYKALNGNATFKMTGKASLQN